MKTLIACLVVILAGCGGGGGAVGAPTPQATPEVTPIIEYYGDSTGAGIDGSNINPGDQSCPNNQCLVVPAPATFISIPGYQVINKSVGGLAAWELLAGKPSAGVPSWNQQMVQSKAGVVLIALGINDSWSSSQSSYGDALYSLAAIAKQQGKKVIFQTANPTNRPFVSTLMVTMREVAAANGIPIIDQETYLLPLVTPDLFGSMHDGIHPNQATYLLMGLYTNARLNQILGK